MDVREEEIVTVLVTEPFALAETVLVRVLVRDELTVPELEPVDVGVRERGADRDGEEVVVEERVEVIVFVTKDDPDDVRVGYPLTEGLRVPVDVRVVLIDDEGDRVLVTVRVMVVVRVLVREDDIVAVAERD